MKQIKTDDESITFYNEDVDETYHSKSGAVEESLKKFVEPCNVKELASKDKVRILDVCFGLGYNSAVAIDKLLEANLGCEIEVVGLENDEKILKKIKEVNPLIQSYLLFKDLLDKNYEVSEDGITIKVVVGDALKTIKKIKGKFDMIFLDPFSPKKHPHLWSEEFFKDLRRLISDEGVLTTYSCARVVRDNLKAVGFEVSDGPCVGRRAPSTVAKPV